MLILLAHVSTTGRYKFSLAFYKIHFEMKNVYTTTLFHEMFTHNILNKVKDSLQV